MLFALASVIGTAGTACQKVPSATPSRPRIALVMKSLANEFFLTMEKGARDHQARTPASYELLASGIKDELDVDAQATWSSRWSRRGCDAIVIAPADSKALVAACKSGGGRRCRGREHRQPTRRRGAGRAGPADPVRRSRQPQGCAAGRASTWPRQLRRATRWRSSRACPPTVQRQQRKLGFEDAIDAAGLKLVASQSGDWEMAKAQPGGGGPCSASTRSSRPCSARTTTWPWGRWPP